jgi:DNA polymerase-3 subunit delta
VAKTGLALQCKAPRAYEAQRWLARWSVQRYGKSIGSAAAGLLIEAVGANLGVLDSELQKLSAAAGNRKEIRDEDVELLAPKSAERTTWEMIDALAEGRTAEALGILERVLTAGEAPVAILGALSWHLRNLARAGRLAVAGMPVRRALQEAGVKPFALERSERHLRRLGRERVTTLYQWLLDADLDLKGRSPGPRPLVLETLLVRLADG